MADEKNTVHTEYTATANMKSAAAELAEFSRKFNSELGTMQKMVDAVDASTMKAVRNYNKMVSSFKQAQNNLQGQGALPQMGGARSKSDIAGEMSTRVGEIDKYRRQVTRALAGTVLDIEAEIKRLQEVFDQLNNNKRKNAELINKTSREIKNLRERADVIKSGPGVSAELTAARSNRAKAQLKQAAADDRFSTKAANELAAAKMRLIAVEDLLNSKGLQKKNRTTALTQEQAKLKELIKSYEDISAVVQKYNQNFTKTLGKELSSKNRQTVSDAKQVLELEQRTALIQDQISKKKAGEIRLDAAAITSLQTELKFSQQLLDLHSKDADIMARAAVLRERMATKQLQIANQVMMAEAEAANREFDRIRAHTRAAQVMMRREADLENREVTRVSRVAQARRELVQAEKNSAQDFMRASAEAENQEISRVRRVATARANAQRAEAEAANREYDLVKRTADLRARRNDPGVAANNFLKNEEAKLKIEAQILRLKQTGTAEDRVQINLLDQELIRLRQEADQLSKIHGIEARISSERAKRTQDARGETKSRLQNIRQNPGELMGIQAELMGNYAAFGAIQGAAQNMVTYVIQGETALAKFQAIAAASNVETAVMAQTMEQLGTNSKYTNLEIIDTATLLAQAGLSARDAGPALKSVAELATAAGTELKQAADVVTSVSNIWGYSTSEMGNVADILTAALNKTKLGMDQMQLGIQYAGNVAVDAGVDFVELTAAMGALAQAGIRSGSTIGTGLRALLVDLQNPNEKAVATMERLGISMEDVNLRTLGLTQVLHNLKAAGFTSADAMGAFEIRAAASFAAISNNLGVLDSLQEDLYGTNAAAAASAIQMNTVSAKWTSFVNVAQSVAKDGFAPVIAAVKVFLDVGADLLKVLNQFPNVTAAVTTGLITLFGALAVTRLAMATVAIAGMITTFGGLGVAATGAAGAVTILGISFTAIPIIGWISGIAAVAAGIWAWTKSMGEAKDTADELKGEINDISSRMQTNRQVTQALDGAVVKLNRQFGVLTEDSKMRDRTLAQTRMRFESLGLEVNKSTQSVEGMIQALEGL
jgi:TP901 family phage tail tape measure protein